MANATRQLGEQVSRRESEFGVVEWTRQLPAVGTGARSESRVSAWKTPLEFSPASSLLDGRVLHATELGLLM